MHGRLILVLAILLVPSIVRAQYLLPHRHINPLTVVEEWTEGISRGQSQALGLLDIIDDKKELLSLFESNAFTSQYSKIPKISKCAISIANMIKDTYLRKSYSLRMIDSWGKFGSGVMTGNTQWLGRYHECENAHAKGFSGKYFFVQPANNNDQAAFGLGKSSFTIGLCLPDTCSDLEVDQVISPLGKLLKTDLYAVHPVQPTKYTAVDITALVITCILACFLIVGTGYEVYLSSRDSSMDYRPFGGTSDAETPQPSVLSNVLTSFSVLKNTKAIFDTNQKEGNINVLHGLRFFSMTWVILGHTFIFGAAYIDNAIDAANVYLSKWTFQAVGNATFSVDSFFFLSGLLAAYLGLREMKKRNGKISVLLPYAYRYLRLTPAYAFCIMISASLYGKFGHGPFWPATAAAFKTSCQKYWWTNLLYINNMYPASLGSECFGWGWYLANDTQFFLLLPFLLYLIHRKPIAGVLVLNFGVLLSMIAAGVVSSHFNQQPQALGIGLLFHYLTAATSAQHGAYNLMQNISNETTTLAPTTPPTPSQPDPFWSDIYAKPWCRMGAYFIGVLAGLILYKTKARVALNKSWALLGWVIASSTAMALVYGLFGSIHHGTALNINLAAFYNAVSRPLWTACLTWLVIACSSGYGGPINTFLSWKGFIPASRLTYCAYLVHPLVIYWMYGCMETKLHFSLNMIAVLYAGIVAISYSLAFCVSLLVEMPMLGITKAFLGRDGGRRNVEGVEHPEMNIQRSDYDSKYSAGS